MKAQLPTIQDHVSLLNVELLFKRQLFNKPYRQSWSSFTTFTIVLIYHLSINFYFITGYNTARLLMWNNYIQSRCYYNK